MDLLDRLRLDVPVAQAGMGGGIAGASLAAAVAGAGGLGTIGLLPPARLRAAIRQVRDEVSNRAVAVNLLMPFARRQHIEVCLSSGVDVVVLGFGGSRAVVAPLREAGVFVFAMVGTESTASEAVAWGVDGLIAQGREAGGHVTGTNVALDFLPRAIAIADGRPVLLAGGIATGADTVGALAAGAAGVTAGTRFVLTEESGAHRGYQQRVLNARRTVETTLFGLGWPAKHRVVPNAATERWCHPDGSARWLPSLLNARSAALGRHAPDGGDVVMLRIQRPRLPLFSPSAPLAGMPDSWVDRSTLYAGESGLRLTEIVTAKQAVAELAGALGHSTA